MFDLHCHSHFSDGTCSVDALLSQALEAGVRVLALTDHDTVEGLKPLQTLAKDKPITIINGIEISVRWKKHDVHILGLNINPESSALIALNARQVESRQKRGREMALLLEKEGLSNAYENAQRMAGHDRVGRPHFAQLLVKEGLAKDMQDAFKKYLVRGKKAYVPTPWVAVQDAVQCIIASGGKAVIAHPFKYKLTRMKLAELIVEFKQAGGQCLEVVSGAMTPTHIREAAGLALRYGLQASTGSDYHGPGMSSMSLGRQPELPPNCTPIWNDWVI